MGFGSLWHWAIVLIVVLILFGRGRISEIMGDFGSGIKSFKQSMDDDESKGAPSAGRISAPVSVPAPSAGETRTGTAQD